MHLGVASSAIWPRTMRFRPIGESRSIGKRMSCRQGKSVLIAPDGFVGEFDVNVNAFDRERLVGGVTLRVHS